MQKKQIRNNILLLTSYNKSAYEFYRFFKNIRTFSDLPFYKQHVNDKGLLHKILVLRNNPVE